MVQPAVVAQGDRAVVVDGVGADSVVDSDDRSGGHGFRAGRVGVGGGAAAEGAVRPDRVVVAL